MGQRLMALMHITGLVVVGCGNSPCAHAIAVIFKLGRRVESYVPNCFRKQMFHDAYHQFLTPIGGMSFWPDTSEMSKVLPPMPHTMPGRTRKKG